MPASTKHAPSNEERENLSPPIIRPKATVYSGRDSVLGASAGLKYFGMRRLGRSGLSNRPPLADSASPTDNVGDVDYSSFSKRRKRRKLEKPLLGVRKKYHHRRADNSYEKIGTNNGL
jgi:hypothetical protein